MVVEKRLFAISEHLYLVANDVVIQNLTKGHEAAGEKTSFLL